MADVKIGALKPRIDRLGRLRMAHDLGMTYSSLSNKLNGFSNFSHDEIQRIEAVLLRYESADNGITSAM